MRTFAASSPMYRAVRRPCAGRASTSGRGSSSSGAAGRAVDRRAGAAAATAAAPPRRAAAVAAASEDSTAQLSASACTRRTALAGSVATVAASLWTGSASAEEGGLAAEGGLAEPLVDIPPPMPSEAAIASGDAAAAAAAAPGAKSPMQRFFNSDQGYAIMVPSSWERVDKMGANALFEDPQRRSTSLGVTVNPVRVYDIHAFGTVDAVGNKLLEAERRKDGTLSVAMVASGARMEGDATLYDYEYDLDSTRGHKRVLNTVTIYESKLYILNGQYKCDKDDEACASAGAKGNVDMLRQVASSFLLMSGAHDGVV